MVLDRSAWAVRVPSHQPVKLASEVGYGNGFASSGQARVPEPQPQAANSTLRSAMEVPMRARSAASPGLGTTLVGVGGGVCRYTLVIVFGLKELPDHQLLDSYWWTCTSRMLEILCGESSGVSISGP